MSLIFLSVQHAYSIYTNLKDLSVCEREPFLGFKSRRDVSGQTRVVRV